MAITTEDVQRMASLARLNIDEPTQELFAKQFADIISYMDILSGVDTTGVEPLYSPVLHDALLREDAVKNTDKRADVLSNAPKSDGQYFIVPRIV